MSTKTKVAYGLVTVAVIAAAGFIVMKTSGKSESSLGAGTAGYTSGYKAPGYVPPGYTAPGYTAPGYKAPGYKAPGYRK